MSGGGSTNNTAGTSPDGRTGRATSAGGQSIPVTSGGKIAVMPITLREANDFVESFHRHSKRTSRDGGKFAIAATTGEQMVGVAIVGNPLSRMLADGLTAEVLRVCVGPDAPRNTCSFLYGRCWRVWQAMGGKRLVTYTLQTESGASLRGAGWKVVGDVQPKKDGWNRPDRKREWQPIYGQAKFRWEVAA